MAESTTTFTYYDPSRYFDGTPYEAAGKAVDQTRAVLWLLDRALSDTSVQVRNAYMSRRLDTGEDDPGAIQWEDSPEARALRLIDSKIGGVSEALAELELKLKAVQMAASYDPKHPPKEVTA